MIDLCLAMYDWAKFQRTKGAVKLHLLLDHDGCLPCYAVITEGKTHEIRVARTLEFPPGAIVAMDRGYVDYAFLDSLEERGVFFVTRLKDKAVFEVEAVLSEPKADILADEMSRPASRRDAAGNAERRGSGKDRSGVHGYGRFLPGGGAVTTSGCCHRA